MLARRSLRAAMHAVSCERRGPMQEPQLVNLLGLDDKPNIVGRARNQNHPYPKLFIREDI